MLKVGGNFQKTFNSESLLFFFDLFPNFEYKIDAVAYSYLYVSSIKSFYLYMDLGLKHSLSLPMGNFFKLSFEDSSLYHWGENFLYLFNKSLGFHFVNTVTTIKTDYFISDCRFSKYIDAGLRSFFYQNFFFRKLNTGFFNLDSDVSSFFINNFLNSLSIVDCSFPLTYVFASDYWYSRNFYEKSFIYKNYFKKWFYQNQDISLHKVFLEYLDETHGKKLYKTFFYDFHFKNLKSITIFFLQYAYLKIHSNFNYLYLKPLLKNKLSSLYKQIKFPGNVSGEFHKIYLFLLAFHSFSQIRYFKFNWNTDLVFNKFSAKFGIVCEGGGEILKDYLTRKNEFPGFLRKWIPNITDLRFGFENFFFFRSRSVEWSHMSNYHKRQLSFRISEFFEGFNNFFIFFFRKKYLNFSISNICNNNWNIDLIIILKFFFFCLYFSKNCKKSRIYKFKIFRGLYKSFIY